MTMISLLDIDRAFSIVIQQERELNPLNLPPYSIIAPTAASQINPTQHTSGNKQWNSNYKVKQSFSCPNRVCTHCVRTNHMIET